MIEIRQVRKGQLVWWSAKRYMSEWSCPAVVTEVKRNSFRVQSLDDFKVTEPLRLHDVPGGGPSSRKEMRLASEQEIRDYLRGRRQQLDNRVVEAQSQFEEAQARLSAYDVNCDRFLAETFPLKS